MKARRTAWTLWVLGVALAMVGLAQNLSAPGAPTDGLAIANQVLNAGFVLVFGLVGALIVGRQPRNTIGWLLMVIALTFALPNFGGSPGPAGGPIAPTLVNLLAAWLNAWSWWLLMGPLLLILLLFPTGRPASPRWRWVIVSLTVCFLIFLLINTFVQGIETADETQVLPNPIGFISNQLLSALILPWAALLLANVVLCVSAVFVRYRRAGPVERQQIKWLLAAGAFFLLAFAISEPFNAIQSGLIPDLVSVLFDIAVLTIPVAIGIAIVRYRLWDIDVIIRRTLIYALLTALLALAYLGSVLVLQSLFGALTGQAQSTLVTVLSTLVIAALFVPLRRRVQAVIDRRLYRRRYDAAKTLAAFATSVRDETDLAQLTERIEAMVQATIQPESVTVWLRQTSGPAAGAQK